MGAGKDSTAARESARLVRHELRGWSKMLRAGLNKLRIC
jgi:hypothetical protein